MILTLNAALTTGRISLPASVAQLDVGLTTDQEIAGSIPAGPATFFHADMIIKYFLWSFSPFC